MPTVLYHYTTAVALARILDERLLRPSLYSHNPQDVAYGEGQYLTDVSPGSLDAARLSRLLLGHPFAKRRFTHFIAIDVSGLTVLLGRKGIFVIPGTENLDLTSRIVTTGTNSNDLSQSGVET